MLNNVNLQGELINDPSFRKTSSGGSYCSITLAIERPKGTSLDRLSDVIPCIAWGKTADFIYKYFHKGDMVVVGGHLQSRQYKSADGVTHTAYEVLVKECNACKGKKWVDNEKEVDGIDWDKIPVIERDF